MMTYTPRQHVRFDTLIYVVILLHVNIRPSTSARIHNSTSGYVITEGHEDMEEVTGPTTSNVRPVNASLQEGNIKKLYVVGMFPLSDHWWIKYSTVFPIIIQAGFDEMATRPDILPGYQLELISKDTKGIPGLGTKRLYEAISDPPTKLAILGPSMSPVTELVSQSVQYWNLHEFLFSARTSSTLDRSTYPNLYRVNFGGHALNPLKVALMNRFGWKRVATLTTDSDHHKSETSAFHINLSQNNFTLITSGIIIAGKSIASHVSRLKQFEARIIFASLSSLDTGRVFCEAYKQGMRSRLYTWILSGYSLYPNWWRHPSLECSEYKVSQAAHRALTVDHKYLRHDNTVTTSGKTVHQYKAWLKTLPLSKNQIFPRTSPFVYDAAWALGLALNASLENLPPGSSLEDFNYSRSDIATVITQAVSTLSFEGVSGPVSFKDDGSRNGYTYLAQISSKMVAVEVGYFDDKRAQIKWYVNKTLRWTGGVPLDQFEYRLMLTSIPPALVIGFSALTAAAGVFAAGLLIFNCYNRKHKIIKLSSPYINNIIILGGIITYAAVYTHAFQHEKINSIHPCMLKIWLTSLGFTIGFGAIFSKTWRVYVLFRSQTIKKKSVKDLELFRIVLLLVLVDVILLTLWTSFHPLAIKELNETFRDDEYILVSVHRECNNEYSLYWIGTIYVYKGLLLVFGVFLAWETRKVTIPALNDSKYIGFAIYNIVVVCLSGIPIVHSLSYNQLTLRFSVVAMLLIFCTTSTLCLVFVPKIQLVLSGQIGRIMFGANGTFSGRQEAGVQGSSNSVCPVSAIQEAGLSTAP